MPAFAIAWLGSPTSSTPSNLIEPARGRTIPMRLFSVVVLPAPLRPISADDLVSLDAHVHVEEDVRIAVVAV